MENVIEFQNVSKYFGTKKVLDGVSFSVGKNDIFGYLGPNGSGKTTSIRLILELLHPDAGKVSLFQNSYTPKMLRNKIGFCLDEEGLYPDLTAGQNLEFYDRVFHAPENRKKRIEELLDKVGLLTEKDIPVSNFSKGMKRRLGIARALINNPELLILDEPTNGLDPDGQKEIKQIIQTMAEHTTVFFSSHNLNDVEEVCNKIAILNRQLLYCDFVKNIPDSCNINYILHYSGEGYDEVYRRFIVEQEIEDYKIDEGELIIRIDSLQQNQIEKGFVDSKLEIIRKWENMRKIENLYFNLTKGE